MKTQAEIVIKAKAYAESIGSKDGTVMYDYAMGYNQCQEDMADKRYTEEDIRKAITFGQGMELWKEEKQIEDFIKSLNKKD